MTAITSRLPSPTSAPVQVGGGANVLIVDGDVTSRSVLEVALKRIGYQVATANDGREALGKVSRSRPPAMIVVSAGLRSEDASALCQRLKAEAKTAHVPVLLLARNGDDERRGLNEVIGVDDFVAKPAFARDIAALVTLWLSNRDQTGGYITDTDTLPLPVMVRALLSTQRAGQLTLGKKTYLAYRAGRLTHASADGTTGTDALVRVLTLATGAYQVSFTTPAAPASIDLSLRELVNGIFPRLARWQQLADRSVPLDLRFQVDFAALAKALPTIPDAVNDVVRLFDGQRSVRQVLFDSPLNEIITLEVANRLQLMGIVREVKTLAHDPHLRTAPKLFEPRESEAEEQMSTLFGSAEQLADSIITPAEFPLPRDEDWYQPPRGAGLDGASENEGWVQQQLSAFNIRSVIEPSEPRPASPEVAAFSRGTAPEPVSPLEQAIAPIQLTQPIAPTLTPTASVAQEAQEALEDQFFADSVSVPEADDALGEADTDPSISVSDAVLGPIEDTVVPARSDPQGTRSVALFIGAMLAVGLILVVVQRLSAPSREAEFIPAPIVLPEPPRPPEPVIAAVEVDQVPPVTVSEEAITSALSDASKLYEQGQFAEAIAQLEQIVDVEPSSVKAWMLMAMARLDNDERARAEEAASTVLALEPAHADAYLLLATIHIRDGNKDAAKNEIARYLELEPNGAHADEAKRLLRR